MSIGLKNMRFRKIKTIFFGCSKRPKSCSNHYMVALNHSPYIGNVWKLLNDLLVPHRFPQHLSLPDYMRIWLVFSKHRLTSRKPNNIELKSWFQHHALMENRTFVTNHGLLNPHHHFSNHFQPHAHHCKTK